MTQCHATKSENNDINNAAFYYSLNMLRMLRTFELISEDEYICILKISAQHYDIDFIYV